jgi:hypothetical protein
VPFLTAVFALLACGICTAESIAYAEYQSHHLRQGSGQHAPCCSSWTTLLCSHSNVHCKTPVDRLPIHPCPPPVPTCRYKPSQPILTVVCTDPSHTRFTTASSLFSNGSSPKSAAAAAAAAAAGEGAQGIKKVGPTQGCHTVTCSAIPRHYCAART